MGLFFLFQTYFPVCGIEKHKRAWICLCLLLSAHVSAVTVFVASFPCASMERPLNPCFEKLRSLNLISGWRPHSCRSLLICRNLRISLLKPFKNLSFILCFWSCWHRWILSQALRLPTLFVSLLVGGRHKGEKKKRERRVDWKVLIMVSIVQIW